MQKPVSHAGASPARRAALDILLELRQNPRSHSDQLLRSASVNRLSSTDRNLTTALVMGVLRWGLELDRRIAAVVGRRREPLDDVVEIAIELGAFQLCFFNRVPAHAAVYESVELVKQSAFASAAGLVNAVLHRLQQQSALQPSRQRADSAAGIARAWAHPEWLVKRWVDVFGLEAAAAICQYAQSPPPLSIRMPAGPGGDLFRQDGLELLPGTTVERAVRLASGRLPDVLLPTLLVQDEGSQLVGELAAGCAASPQNVLDCCTAPGGKLSILLERLPSARVVAVDLHAGRLAATRKLLGRRHPEARVEFRQADAAALGLAAQFDLVLLDAPCSGTGTLARNPEIRYRLSPSDLLRQQERQIRLLRAAMDMLAKGGRLVYSTCSLEQEENEQVVQEALRASRGFHTIPANSLVSELEERKILRPGSTSLLFPQGTPAEFLRTLPGIHPWDGFFAAVLARADG